MNILVVDDDIHIQKLIKIHLQRAGYQVLLAGNGLEALEVLKHSWPDLAIVDVMMPEMDGLTLTKILSEQYEIPVLLLTARGTLEDKEEGFLAGSDDYVVKPFEPKELLYRLAVIVRRIDKSLKVNIEIGNVSINRSTYEVMIGKETLIFPLKEFEILCLLASKPEQVFTRSQIMEKVWGYDYEGDDHTLNTHITRVRQRLERASATMEIQTIRGLGYKIDVNSR
ncbi:MAG TPA: response regulator transcription factor [Candidatus Paenibacillus intestinavium]|nr:response regulator transcription factor [Candidatus Paenibacillus intestinavium]